jgi:hypothetical protein
MALFGFGTYQVFNNLQDVSASVATAYATLAALPPAAITLIKWRIGK